MRSVGCCMGKDTTGRGARDKVVLAVNRCKNECAEVSLTKYGEEGLSNEVESLQDLLNPSDGREKAGRTLEVTMSPED